VQEEEYKRIKKPALNREIEIPDAFKNLELWQTRRRTFLKAALLTGALSQISFLQSCETELEKGNDILSAEQLTILKSILLILFPDDGNGPSAEDINAYGYIMWVLQDTLNRKSEDNEYIIEGLDWADETANELYFLSYNELDQEQKEAIVGHFTKLQWGRNWSSAMIILIMESLLLDPLYGGNTNEIGWNWLNHKAGVPRPTESLRYERIMERQMKLKI
jgi:gluconate 2-dehydrogenase gamma chain